MPSSACSKSTIHQGSPTDLGSRHQGRLRCRNLFASCGASLGIISVLVTTDSPNNHNNPTHVCKFCKKSTSPRSLAILSLLCVFSSLICHHIPISRSLMVFKAPHLKGGLHLPQPQELLRHAVPMRFGVFLNATNATLFEATGQSGS